MNVPFLTVEDIRTILKDNFSVYLKYVRVADEYRFVLGAETSTVPHLWMLKQGEIAESAAFITVYRDYDSEVQGVSESLGIGSADDDEKNILKLILG